MPNCEPPPVDAVPPAVVVKVFIGCTPRANETAVEYVQAVRRVVAGVDPPAEALMEIYKVRTQAETAAGFVSWPSPPRPTVRSARTTGSTIALDFTGDLERVNNLTTTNLAAIFFREVALTASQFPEIRSVRVTVDGDERRFCAIFDEMEGEDCATIAVG